VRRILIALGLAFWSAAVVAVPVRISVRLSGPAAEGVRKARLAWSASRADVQGGSAVVDVPGETILDLPSGPSWTVRAELEGFWSEDRTFVVRDAGGERIEVVLFPAGFFEGSFDPGPAEEAPPAEISVRFRPAPAQPGGPRLPEGIVSCPVEEGVWRCHLPAGDLDLRLKAGSYLPVYLWGVQVRASQRTKAGALRLRPGAAVVGWVETEPEGLAAVSCRVMLNPEAAGPPTDAVTLGRLEALLLESRTNDRGFFQVEAVPPGRYTLSVSSPGFATAEIGPVEVRSGLEAEVLDPIVLRKPVRFEALLDPPVDPYGEPWRIVLQARPPASVRHEGQASKEGLWAKPDVAPGWYDLGVLGDLGSRWLTQEVEVRAGQAPLPIQIPLVEIHGRLRQGDEPLSGTLWFGGLSGSRRIRFDADEGGELSGFLPEEGLWKVELFEESGSLRVGLEPVEVRRLPGARRAEVEIVVPDTTLAGEVVDEAGKPVPGASLQVDSVGPREKQKASRFEADAEGKFRIRGLAPGPASVEAELGEQISGWIPITLQDKGESPWLRLVVRARREVRGRIVSAGGPVSGARIEGFPDFGDAAVATGVEATSDPTGEFSLALPPGIRAVHLRVLAPGFAFRLLKASVVSGQALEIALEPQAGTLILERAAGQEGSPPPPSGLLFHGGTFLPLELLHAWVRLQGIPWPDHGPLIVPGMEMGEYALCSGREAVGAALAGAEPPASSCSRGFLAPFGELFLKKPGV
jgi:hypothetical protein